MVRNRSDCKKADFQNEVFEFEYEGDEERVSFYYDTASPRVSKTLLSR